MNGNHSYQCFTLSTAHVTPEQRKFLDLNGPVLDNRVFVRDSGWFVKLAQCDDFYDLEDELNYFKKIGLSSEHLNVVEHAIREGYGLIEFDCDADPFRGLPLYEDVN